MFCRTRLYIFCGVGGRQNGCRGQVEDFRRHSFLLRVELGGEREGVNAQWRGWVAFGLGLVSLPLGFQDYLLDTYPSGRPARLGPQVFSAT